MPNTIIPSKTRLLIALEYGFSIRTLHRKLKKYVPELPGRELLSGSQQKLIYTRLGWPTGIAAEAYLHLP